MLIQKRDKLTVINTELPHCVLYGLDTKKNKIEKEWKQIKKLQEYNDVFTSSKGGQRPLGEIRDIKLECVRHHNEKLKK